jgi:hypothetical protein
MKLNKGITLTVLAWCMPLAAMAAPTYTSFGSLPGATFGGSGIPNDAVAVTTITDGGNTITLGLTAHGRYANPATTNDGAGTFYAGTGQNCGIATDPVGCPSGNQGALWNFAYYIDIAGGGNLSNYSFGLNYDFDPGTGTSQSALGTININNALVAQSINPASLTNLQGSENLLFSIYTTGFPTVITPPSYASFNPNAVGEYSFYLTASNNSGLLGTSAIDVNAVPVPAGAWLFGSAVGLLGFRRRLA